jgi:serine protease Do
MNRGWLIAGLVAVVGLWPAQVRADRASRRTAVVEVVERASPAVVHIATERIVEGRSRTRHPFFGDLDELFGLPGQRKAVESLGSGAIIDPSGVIVTNEHVIRGASAIQVTLADGRRFDAEVIGSDADNDLAVLKAATRGPLPAARLGGSGDLMIGETVIAIGSPFGLSKTVTAGVISAVGRSFRANGRVYNDFVQTDASINPGNSGGPLLNLDGEVIGINTAIFASAQGIGFAIPSDKVQRIVQELTQFGKVRPAWVGARVQFLSRELAAGLGWDRSYGALVVGAEPGSPAEEVGLGRGDIIAEVAGAPVMDHEDFEVRMRGYPARTPVPLTVFRAGKRHELTLTPVEFPLEQVDAMLWQQLGFRVKEARGVLVIAAVRSGSPADQVGLATGDVLLRLNNQQLSTQEALREALLSARTARSVLLLVRRGRYGYHLTLPF